MLVSRPFDSGRNTWSSRKFEDIFHSVSSPRMSTFEGLASQSDWRDQYSAFPLASENAFVSSAYEANEPELNHVTPTRAATTTRPPLGNHRHTTANLLQEEQEPIPKIERPDSAPGDCGNQQDEEREEHSLAVNGSEGPLIVPGEATDSLPDVKDEDDDDVIEDDEMLEVEEGGAPQTAAERRAERRKMKRFRYSLSLSC